MKIHSITTKLSLILFLVIASVLSIAGFAVNRHTEDILTKNIEKEVSSESEAVSKQVNDFFDAKKVLIESITSNQTILHYLSTAQTRDEAWTNQYYNDTIHSLEEAMSGSTDVAMVWVASEKGNFLTGTGGVLSDPDFELSERPWYEGVTKADGVYFTEPYMDQVFGKVIMSVMKEVKVNNEPVGIVAIDIFLDSLPSIMDQYKIGKTGYSILLAPDGKAIYHPNEKLVMDKPFTSEKGDMGAIAKEMVAGKNGLKIATIDDKEYYIGYGPVETTNWSVATTVTKDEVYAPLKNMTKNLIIYFTITILILISITYFLLKKMLKNVSSMSEIIKKVSAGDLTHRLDYRSKDELGQVSNDLNSMLDHLKGLIHSVQDHAAQVAASSEQLNSSTEQTAEAAQIVARTIDAVTEGALQQSSSTKKVAETTEKMSEMFLRISSNSEMAARNSEEAVQKAKRGEDTVVSAVAQMETIKETVDNAADTIVKLGERSKEIGKIVETISDISNQTNLLALNAAIEASHAGEHGQGFSVVANEVKKLAEESKQSAGKISEVIKEIQSETDIAVTSITHGTHEVKKGSEVIQNTGMTFHEITSIVSQVFEQMKDVSSAIRELSLNTKHIVEMAQDVDKLAASAREQFENVAGTTEEQTATLEEIASASQELSSMASSLQDSISRFKI
jgi:methyl-accepting chemotaxis protein